MAKVGLAYLNNASRESNTNSTKLSGLEEMITVARVADICLNSNSTLFNSVGGWNGIGTISWTATKSGVNDKTSSGYNKLNIAKPLLPNSKNYPLVNENVLLFQLPTSGQSQATGDNMYYYLNPVSLWSSQHHNAYPNVYNSGNTVSPSQNKNYLEIEQGSTRKITPSTTSLDFNGNSGGTFVEKSNIHPILAYAGDNILEGRFGNSIRLGNTSKTDGITNNWSNSGENGSPITIIRNGQPAQTSDEGFLPITEDINLDLASVYLTSTQQIPIDVSVAKVNVGEASTIPFSDMVNKTPTSPRSYNKPQVILNSNRLLFNTNLDSIIFSSAKSFIAEAIEDVGIKSKSGNVNILSEKGIVSLGKKGSKEGVILGSSFIEQFSILLGNLSNLVDALNNEPQIPIAASQAVFVKQAITNIQNNLPNLISNSVKVS